MVNKHHSDRKLTQKTESKSVSKGEKGVTIIEVAMSIGILLFVTFVGADMIVVARYSSAAQWLAITAARVGSVTVPFDGNVNPPNSAALKLPVSSSPSYLPAWEDSTRGCNGGRLSPRHRRTINLVLGEANRILQNKARTPTNWISNTDVGNVPEKGELIVVPVNCTNDPENERFTEWRVCVNVPSMFYSFYTCHHSSSEVADA